ncbi:sugar phosphate isomerase/epimerase [Nissabacter sp. SGAir0207]|uniref:sugar phosphate isomerase/epimerase family protein n=1 Tax=Nissabacter sp. SGAir0207 TaxID=2126321 RepID=UPI0010CD68CA|nr:sugar phosphate isomerase/epimerase [Nissabacter sp. SGAir0207]QCR34594.1 xylose isomerase [Nissabacter sp. SGAir0207]
MSREIVVVTAAYGSDRVRELGGQAALLPVIAEAGADSVEIRRELMDQQALDDLPHLAEEIVQYQLGCVYSVPEALFDEDGAVNAGLEGFFLEAQQLGARVMKLSLGHYRAGCDLSALKTLLEAQPVRLVVENDQTPECGILLPMSAFLRAAAEAGLPLGMTFDMGNWHWVGQAPQRAADTLADHVTYVHVKAAARHAGKWCAVALDNSDGQWRELLDRLPAHAPRGIEFPLEGDDLIAVTRHYVELLRAE